MNNCLVTKLKATVNNPNLPILETMQQFTLDAIAASGNDSMTESQKWALNHFFYKIGAISNDGIYAKMEHLLMPLICNQNTAKAPYDYKTNTTYSTGTFEFVGNGIKGVTFIGSNQIIRNIAASDIFVAIAFTEQNSTFDQGAYIKLGDNTYSIGGVDRMDRGILCSKGLIDFSPRRSCCGIVTSRYGDGSIGDNWKRLLFSTDKVYGDSGTFTAFSTSSSSYKADPETPYNISLTLSSTNVSGAAFSVWAWGTHLSEGECATLADAIRELVVAFPDPVNNG